MYLKKEKGYERVKALLSSNDVHLLINDINLGETFYILARERGREGVEYFVNTIFPALPITNISNTLSDVLEAAKIKSQYSISFADCFAIATALKEKASIVTGDIEFKKVQKLVKVEWI